MSIEDRLTNVENECGRINVLVARVELLEAALAPAPEEGGS